MATIERTKTCKECNQASGALDYCDRCFHRTTEARHHAGFRVIQAILGDDANFRGAIESLGGLIELQETIGELATKADEWDVLAMLKEYELDWLEGSF